MSPRRTLHIDLSPLRRSRDLRLLFVGGGVSFAGSMLTFVAVPYQAYELSHSSLVVGLISLAELVPLLVTAFVGGALADAVDRRAMLRVTEGVMCLGSAALVANALLGRPQLWVLFAVAMVVAGVDGLQRPSLDALVPRLVPPAELPATSAIMSLRTQFGMIAAPAASGAIIAAGGLATAYAIDIGSFVVGLAAYLLLSATPPPAEKADVSLGAIREGLRYAWRRKDLLGSYLVDMNAMFFGMPNALFPQLASHFGGASALGVLYAAPAMGSFLVTATSGWTSRVRHHGRMIATGAALWGLGIVALGWSDALWEAAVALVIAGGGDMVSGLGRSTMWNQSIPDTLRGRLAGIEMLSYSSGPTLGNVEAGLLETFAGLRASIVSGGAACVVGTGLVCVLLRRFWNYDARLGERERAGAPADPAGGPQVATPEAPSRPRAPLDG
jgi:MFS family permease